MPHEILILLFFLHWWGDFVCQTRWMADNKSKNLLALTAHVLTYTLVLTGGLILFSVIWTGGLIFACPQVLVSMLVFGIINFLLHWLTDITTSQFTKYYWKEKNVHAFFMVIGFDQFIHTVCLVVTAGVFLK